MTRPREAQLELLLTISEGLSRGSHEMLRVSPTDAMHAPSCGLAIRDAVEELKWMRAENERLRADRRERIATAALQGILACQKANTALPKEWTGIFAILSVGCADALIAKLDEEKGEP